MKSLYLAMLCFILCTLASNNLKAQYPFRPQNAQNYINGTIGEERGGRSRYHYGLDFAAPDGTNVYCIETGPLRKKDGASFAIGTYGYIHVIPNTVTKQINGTIITAGTLIGTVQNGKEHVHLQRATQNFSDGTDQSNITAWEDQTFEWINPILELNPFSDNASPRIQ
jgi:hypothetical protein